MTWTPDGPLRLECPHCGVMLLDDGISLRCPTHGPIEVSPSTTDKREGEEV